MKKFLLSLFLCSIFGNASATTVSFGYYVGEYLPFTYVFSQPVDVLSVLAGYDIQPDSQYIQFNSIVQESIIGANLFTEDGTQVGAYQNINNLSPSAVVFSKAEFFLTTAGVGSFSKLDSSFLPSDCPFITCTYSETQYGLNTRLAEITFQASVNPVPEPESYALILSGLGLIGFISHRRRFGKVSQTPRLI